MDPVGICNIALAQIGEKRLTQLDDQNPLSRVEELCATHYAAAVAAALEEREWSFATSWVKLAALADVPVHPTEGKKFLLPGTVLRVVGVDDGSGDCTLLYRKEGRYLYTVVDSLYVRAIHLVEDPAEWSPNFRFAVAYLLASMLAVPITENKSLRDDMKTEYEVALRKSAALDGMQGKAERVRNSGPRPSDMRG